MRNLTAKERKTLERAAHNLSPVLLVGQGGVTPGFTDAVATALDAHELIKIKFNEYKDEREDLSQDIAQKTGATLVRIIGNTAIFYKQNKDKEKRKIKL